MAMTFAQQELLSRKAELNSQILKTIESMRAHGVSLATIAEGAGVSRRVLLSLRNHRLTDVSYDTMYIIAVSMGMAINIQLPRVIRA